MKLNIRPVFRFRLRDTLKGAAAFFGIMAVITAVFVITALRASAARTGADEFTASFSSYGVAVVITFFVFGICSVREDLRLCLQCGVSRSSMFLGTALSGAASAALLSAAGELLNAIGQAFVAGKPGIMIADLYQVVFLNADIMTGVGTMGFADHIRSFVMIFLLVCLAMAGGSFLSMMFYRLPKAWKLVVAIGVPVMMTFGLPVLASIAPAFTTKVGEALARGLSAAFASYPRSMISLLALALLVCCFDWLLLRRAPVKAAK